MVAVCGETTGLSALKYMQRKMQADQVGQSLLETRPRINSSTVDMDRLRKLGADTFGRQYVNMLDKYVRFICHLVHLSSNKYIFYES